MKRARATGGRRAAAVAARAQAEALAADPAAVLLEVEVTGPAPDVAARDAGGNRLERAWILGREQAVALR